MRIMSRSTPLVSIRKLECARLQGCKVARLQGCKVRKEKVQGTRDAAQLRKWEALISHSCFHPPHPREGVRLEECEIDWQGFSRCYV
jgi:hypothetical protein